MRLRKHRAGIIAVVLGGGLSILIPYIYVLASFYSLDVSVYAHTELNEETGQWDTHIDSNHYGTIIPPANTGWVYGNHGYIDSSGQEVKKKEDSRSLYYPNNSAYFELHSVVRG